MNAPGVQWVERERNRRRAAWARRNNVELSNRLMERILAPNKWTCVREGFPPQLQEAWWDHGEVWARSGLVVALTSNPYAPCFWSRNGPGVLAGVEALGLVVRVFGPEPSWHFPGETMLVEVWRSEAAPTRRR